MMETLKTLCALNGVSGDEGAVRDYIRNSLDVCSDEAEKSSCKLYLTALIRRDSFDLEEWMKTLEDFEG